MLEKDSRIVIMDEVLSGIKVFWKSIYIYSTVEPRRCRNNEVVVHVLGVILLYFLVIVH